MVLCAKKKFKVIFEPNAETVDSAVFDALLTQLMITITKVGLRIDRFGNTDDTIRKE